MPNKEEKKHFLKKRRDSSKKAGKRSNLSNSVDVTFLMASTSTDFKIEQRAYVKIRTLLKISPTDVHKDLEEFYKDTALPYSTVVDWARRFREGRVSIEDEARIGRPVSSASDKNILEVSALLEEDPHITLVEIADGVGISTGTAQAIVHDNMIF
ncbi:hypothetical protein LOD99_15865 [Oopsacas minuta]|uniref:Transposase n=1 Tax=Oopsacas minuta TaxID=111878 RepID=A0AAV7K9N7_9METZ|nr:hypothetical protein LOD99_15865 [Oopsacas minuta]